MDITTFGSIAGVGLLITLTVALIKAVFGDIKDENGKVIKSRWPLTGRITQVVTIAVSFIWVGIFGISNYGDIGKLNGVEAVIAAIVVAATAIGIHQVKTGGQ